MAETRTFLQGATLAIAVAIPIVAVSSVLLCDDNDSDDRVPCDGCGELHAPDELALGPFDTRWCEGCDAGAGAHDCVQEDDGEP